MKLSLLIIICSKNPTEILIKNIINLYKIFNIYDLKICIIDSCSTDLTIYNEISKKFPQQGSNLIIDI